MKLIRDVLQEKFYFLHINCYVRTDVDGIVVPCEIALLEYSIKDGGTKVYHKFLRIRYACASKEVLEKTHRIPLPPVELKPCVKHASEVYTHILQFLLGKEVGDAEPLNLAEIEQEISKIPLFCAKVEHEITKECLGAIVADSRMRAVPFMVFHLDYLLHQLASMSADWAMEKLLSEKQQSAEGSDDEVELTEKEKNRFCHFPEKEAAEMFINRELFDHAPEVACNRWSFMVSDVVCMNMGVKMIENRHCQVRAKLSSSPQRGFGKNSKGRKADKRAFQQSKTKRVSSGWVQPKSAPSEDDDYVPVTPAQSVSREAFLEGERHSRGQLRASTARLDMQQSFGGTGSRSPPSANVPAPQRDAAETRTVRATVNLPANESAPPGFAQHSGSRVTGVGRGGAPAHLSGNGTLPQSVGATAAAGHWDIPTRSTLAMQDRYRERLSSTRGSQPMERATSPTDSVSHRSLGSGLPRFLMESESEYAANSSRPSSAMSISAQSRASSAMSLATTGRTGVVPFTINPPRTRQEPRATTNRRRELPVEPQYFVDCNNEPVDISDDGPSLDNFNAVFRPGANVENAGQAALRRPLPMSVGAER
ncbi:hypothetical protein B566_EDAN010400 [Ephemera danica]|nr:hypothetical protein B566_EDAN010400 [Ephemera danica]